MISFKLIAAVQRPLLYAKVTTVIVPNSDQLMKFLEWVFRVILATSSNCASIAIIIVIRPTIRVTSQAGRQAIVSETMNQITRHEGMHLITTTICASCTTSVHFFFSFFLS